MVGATSASNSRASVVLPLPLSPTMAVIEGLRGVDREREILERDVRASRPQLTPTPSLKTLVTPGATPSNERSWGRHVVAIHAR